MLVRMIGTACGPEYVLRAGKVYDLPRAIARKMCEAKIIGAARPNGKGGVDVNSAGSAALVITRDQLKKGEKILKMNPRPDPEERVEVMVDDDSPAVIDDE